MSIKKTQDLLLVLTQEYQDLVRSWRQLWLSAGTAGKRQILVDTITGAGYDGRPTGRLGYATDKTAPLGEIHTEFRTNLRAPSSETVLCINWADQPGLVLGDHQLSAVWLNNHVAALKLSRFNAQGVDSITKDGVFSNGTRIAPCRTVLTVLGQFERGITATRDLMDEISRNVLGMPES